MDQRECFFAREEVFEVGEVEQVDDRVVGEVEEEAPEGHATRLGPEIEECVVDGGEREMDDAFVRAEPAELMVVGELLGEFADVCHDVFDIAPDDAGMFEHGVDGFADEVVAPAHGECEAGARETGAVGVEVGDGIGINRIAVDGVGAFAWLEFVARVGRGDAGDHGHWVLTWRKELFIGERRAGIGNAAIGARLGDFLDALLHVAVFG